MCAPRQKSWFHQNAIQELITLTIQHHYCAYNSRIPKQCTDTTQHLRFALPTSFMFASLGRRSPSLGGNSLAFEAHCRNSQSRRGGPEAVDHPSNATFSPKWHPEHTHHLTIALTPLVNSTATSQTTVKARLRAAPS